MDLKRLNRLETARKIYTAATGTYTEVKEGAKQIIDKRIEKREDSKQCRIDEVLARRSAASRRTVDINTLFGRSSQDPIIILGRLNPRSHLFVAVTLTTQYSKGQNLVSKGLPRASFYKVKPSDLEKIQENPFNQDNLEFCEVMDTEISLTGEDEGYLRKSVRTTTPKIPGEFFNPLGALDVAANIIWASRQIGHFEKTLDVVEPAISNYQLNPSLARSLEGPVPNASHWALAQMVETVPVGH